jgi:hypothetical protein
MIPTLAVVINQRDSYDWPDAMIAALMGQLPPASPVLYVDGGSPEAVRCRLQEAAARWGFQIERRDGFVSANEARQLGLDRLPCSHLLCLENDVRLEPGCVQELLKASLQQNAEVVLPVVLEEASNGLRRVHVAGGRCRLRRLWRWTWLEVTHDRRHDALQNGAIGAGATALAEYHVLLLQAAFGRAHPLHDPAIPSVPETLDFSLAIQHHGGSCWLEPAAAAVFLTPSAVLDVNRPLFLQRWSEPLQRHGIEAFRAKWKLGAWRVLRSQRRWVRAHRSLARPQALHRRFGLEVYGVWNRRLLAPLEELGDVLSARLARRAHS